MACRRGAVFPRCRRIFTELTARPRVHADMIGPWVRMLVDFLIPLPREAWTEMTWRGSPPFVVGDWMPVSARMCFEDRELVVRQREDFFLQKWPNVFAARGTGRLLRPLDYAVEVPHEIKRGGASVPSVFFRRARRLIGRARFRHANP